MAGDVRVTLGANLEVTTSGVDDAKRKASEVQSATESVRDTATAAGDAVTEAMREAADATRETAEAMRQAAESAAAAARASVRAARIGEDDITDARASTINREHASASILARTGNVPEALAARAQQGLVGVEASLAGGVSTTARQAQLEERLKRAEFYVSQAAPGLAPEKMDALAEHLDAVREALEKNRGAIEQNTGAAGGGGGGVGGLAPTQASNPVMDTLVGELRRVAGAGLGSMGMLGRVMGAAGPIGLGVGALVGGTVLARHLLQTANAPYRAEVMGLADLGRQYDTDENPLGYFRQTEGAYAGFTSENIARMGYTGTQAAEFMARLDLPSAETARADTETGLAFSRGSGISENNVADFLRVLGLGGIERGGDATERSLSIVREAMRDGVRDGVSASDTFRNMESALTGMFQSGVNLTEAGVAFQAGLLSAGAETGNRQWQGAQGAVNMGRYQDAITGGGDLAMQLALTNRTGGFTADDLGLEGEQATRYENVRSRDQITAMRLAFDLAKNNPEVMRRLAVALKQVLGGDVVLLAHYLRSFGLQGDALLELLGDDPDALIQAAANEAAEQAASAGGTSSYDPQAGALAGNDALAMETAEADARFVTSAASARLFGGSELGLRSLMVNASSLFGRGVLRTESGGSIFDPYETPAGPAGSGVLRSYSTDPTSADVVRGMVNGVETNPDIDWLDPRNLSSVGAFGPTQIMPFNLTGAHGWDQASISSRDSGEARDLGLDPNDIIPDHLIIEGDDAASGERIRQWTLGLDPEQQEFIRDLLVRISVRKVEEYMRIARGNGATAEEAAVMAGQAWFTGPNATVDGVNVLTPGFDGSRYNANPDSVGLPADEYGDRIREHLPTSDPNDDGGSLPRDQRLTIVFEGLDSIRVEGATASQNDRVRDAAQMFVEAIVAPQSYRGA